LRQKQGKFNYWTKLLGILGIIAGPKQNGCIWIQMVLSFKKEKDI
jgi:hypothetical protein